MSQPSSHQPNEKIPNDSSTPAICDEKARKISRRQFGRDAAIATAASLSVPALIAPIASAVDAAEQQKPKTAAQQKPGAQTKPPESASTAAQQKSREPLKGLTPKQVADVDAKLANILRKHPDRFTDAQKKRLRRILAQHERLLAPVRAFHVENGDSPTSVLRVAFEDVVLPKQGGK